MTELEYDNAIIEIDNDATRKKVQLAKVFAEERNVIEVGATISDHIGSIIVEKIQFSRHSKYPVSVYYGPELTKQGNLRKDGSMRHVYASNLI